MTVDAHVSKPLAACACGEPFPARIAVVVTPEPAAGSVWTGLVRCRRCRAWSPVPLLPPEPEGDEQRN